MMHTGAGVAAQSAAVVRREERPAAAAGPEFGEAGLAVGQTPQRVLLIDTQALARQPIRAALHNHAELTLVGEATTAAQALQLAQELAPHIVILALGWPDAQGQALMRRLAALVPDAQMVVLAPSVQQAAMMEALRAGASGYLTLDTPPQGLARALSAVARGEMAIPRRIAAWVLAYVREATVEREHLPELTAREQEVVQLLAQGATDREIARRLVIAESTAKKHVQHILRKLRARNRAEAVAKYQRLRH